MNNSPDPKALKILLNYDILSPHSTSNEEFEYAKKANLLFDPELQSHEDALALAFQEAANATKRHMTSLFLTSFGLNRIEWRAGLAAYAIMQSFPAHPFKPASTENDFTCDICCSKPIDNVNRSFLNNCRFLTGGIVTYYIYEIAFDLQQHNLLPFCEPTEDDFKIFSDILTIISEAEGTATPTKVQKQLRLVKGFKSTEEQRRALMTTLGYCSMLETEKHKGFLHTFSNMCQVPRKSRSTDWYYPIDWWMGSDGLNKEAVKFWFGDYPQLKKFWE